MTTTESLVCRLYRAGTRKREAAIAAVESELDGDPQAVFIPQEDAARLISASRFTIRGLVKAGQLHPVRILGLVRYRRDEVLKLGEVV